MKIVREHINEKFTEESDPIRDMGIGMQNRLDKFFEESTRVTKNSSIRDILQELAKNKEYTLLDFLLRSKNLDINTVYPEDYGLILSNVTFEGMWDIAKELVKRGANIDKTIERVQFENLPITLERLLQLKKMVEKENLT